LDKDSIGTLDHLEMDSGIYTPLGLWGPMDGFKQILSRGDALDPNDSNCHQVLVSATTYGQTEIVSYFLDNGFDVNGIYQTRDGDGTLLQRAVVGSLNYNDK
jgi:hypothetical protein